ncbi:hypothetical protein SAMN05445756_1105 [Kytococcus aerolatus]|uniref:Lipoprotein n=1 Tax=Kytococcus aerolatus TaxID=592308 RepID=A0A212TEB5_9MICO|nr:hypothetical protein [Kytococcus aerolatus]SNC64408.1 hypothetical protein SAMN05445756_1105 [Kytococcus aerolatus]
MFTRFSALVMVGAALTVAGCDNDAEDQPTSSDSTTSATSPSPSEQAARSTDGPSESDLLAPTAEGGVLYHELPDEAPDVRMSGTFDYRDGCLTSVDPDTDERYPVSIPVGSTVDADGVTLPDGTSIALGEPFHSGGWEERDGGSDEGPAVADMGTLDQAEDYVKKCDIDPTTIDRFLWVHGELSPATD